MSDFPGFSEAAEVYAKNAAVVDAMYKAFEESIGVFLDSLRDAVRERLGARQLIEHEDAESRYWRIQAIADAAQQNPCVWVSRTDPGIVFPGEVRFGVGTSRANLTAERIARIHALASDADLKKYHERQSHDSWHLLALKISYPEGNPVAVVAPVLATLLLKITAASEQ